MADPRSGKTSLLREVNHHIVLNIIAKKGPISRIDVTRQSNLPIATVSRITNEFLEAGLLSETTSSESRGGRPPLLLELNPKVGYVVGVKLNQDYILVVVCDLHCTIVKSHQIPLKGVVEPDPVIALLVKTIDECVNLAGISIQDVLGIGVGLAGLIDSQQGICHHSPRLPWHNVALGPALEQAFHIPVLIDNDVNTLTIAARQFGFGQSMQNFLLFLMGSGVGLGVVVNGEIYRGSHGYSGEFGHFTMDRSAQAPLCKCGKRGCLEAFISDYGLFQIARNRQIKLGDSQEAIELALVKLAQDGDSQAEQLLTETGRMIGVALAHLINLFDTEQIFVIGTLSTVDFIHSFIDKAFHEALVFPTQSNNIVSIMPDMITEDQWARGAASLIFNELFHHPLYESHKRSMLVVEDLLMRARQYAS